MRGSTPTGGLVPALVTTAVWTRGAFGVASGVAPRTLTIRMFGSRFDGPRGTGFGLLFAGTDLVLGWGLQRSRGSAPAPWLWAGVGVDALHAVLAATNHDVTGPQRRATATMIGGLAAVGAVLARASSRRQGPRGD